MTYQSQFVAVVKVNGKILREQNDVVTLPFQSEYSILLKNLSSKRAKVDVTIDGVDVLNGTSLVINAGQESELEGFMKDLKVKNKFKFIQKTEKIQEFRGDKIDDGIIRVEYQFEEQKPLWNTTQTVWFHSNSCPWCLCNPCTCWLKNSPRYGHSHFTIGSTVDNITHTSHDPVITSSIGSATSRGCADVNVNYSAPILDEGITVPGSDTDINYFQTHLGALETQKHSIVFRLRGQVEGGKIVKPMTVKDKIRCLTCGTSSSSICKFCPECGTALIQGYVNTP